jgi:hypothetical protein
MAAAANMDDDGDVVRLTELVMDWSLTLWSQHNDVKARANRTVAAPFMRTMTLPQSAQ